MLVDFCTRLLRHIDETRQDEQACLELHRHSFYRRQGEKYRVDWRQAALEPRILRGVVAQTLGARFLVAPWKVCLAISFSRLFSLFLPLIRRRRAALASDP